MMKINLAASLGAIILIAMCSRARLLRAQDDEGPTSSIHVVVVRDADGKAVKYAQVVLHPVNRKGKSKGEMDLKTDADGRASLDGVPYGSVEVQVVAKGFQTFGQDYEVKQPQLEITVKLKHPAGQYSIYDNHDDKNAPPQKPR
ncbi:MAG: carboxypeptidase-like regulatory domain-containing protein [Terriglobales bacterium]